MTSVSHGILHLSTPIIPDHPPAGIPPRSPSLFLLGALYDLFDNLSVVTRALQSSPSLVYLALHGSEDINKKQMSYAETVVLKSCRTSLNNWSAKWREGVQCERPHASPLIVQTKREHKIRCSVIGDSSLTLLTYTRRLPWSSLMVTSLAADGKSRSRGKHRLDAWFTYQLGNGLQTSISGRNSSSIPLLSRPLRFPPMVSP